MVGWLFTWQVQEKKNVRTSLCNCGTLRRGVDAVLRPRQRNAMPCLDAIVNGVDCANDARALAAMEVSKLPGRKQRRASPHDRSIASFVLGVRRDVPAQSVRFKCIFRAEVLGPVFGGKVL